MVALLIGSGFAADIPYVFDNNSSNITGYNSEQLERISAMSADLIGVPPLYISRSSDAEGVSEASKNRGPVNKETWTMDKLKEVFNSRVEPDNDFVRHKAKMLAATYPGDRNIDQICSVYRYMKVGDVSEKGWSYVSGPRDIHPPSYPNDTLKVGEAKGFSGVGDCNDFAILMSCLIESIGGTTRVILTYNRDMSEGHAYAEVYLGNAREDQVKEIIKWLKQRYETYKIFTHINSTNKEVWLNLDWSVDRPGGPFYKGDMSLGLGIREDLQKTALRITNDSKKIEAENWISEGLALFREKKYYEAISSWNKSIELNPQDATAWFSIGCALGEQANYGDAVKAYDKAIEINPNFAKAWNNKGYAFRNQGKYDEALKAYDKAIELDPNDALAWDNKAYALYDLGRSDEALLAIEKSIATNPKFAKAWNRKGSIFTQQGRYSEAMICYEKAIDLDPGDAISWNNEGWTFYLMGEYDKSLESVGKAIELDPNVAEFWDTKGAALAELGRHIEAIACYDKALELDKYHEAAWYHKGVSLSAIGRYPEAETAFAIARDLGHNGPDL
jgi:tetratricopeptide (TPR) repeat protein